MQRRDQGLPLKTWNVSSYSLVVKARRQNPLLLDKPGWVEVTEGCLRFLLVRGSEPLVSTWKPKPQGEVIPGSVP